MPTVKPLYAPHKARRYTVSNGVRTAQEMIEGHLVISSTNAAVETGVINENELGKFIFGTYYRANVQIGNDLLVNGEYYRVVGPVEIMNAVALLQRCECAVQRIQS